MNLFASQLFAANSPPRGVLWIHSVALHHLFSLIEKPLDLIEIHSLKVIFCSLSSGKPFFFLIGCRLNSVSLIRRCNLEFRSLSNFLCFKFSNLHCVDFLQLFVCIFGFFHHFIVSTLLFVTFKPPSPAFLVICNLNRRNLQACTSSNIFMYFRPALALFLLFQVIPSIYVAFLVSSTHCA